MIANLHVATWPFFFIIFLPYIGEYIIILLSDIIIYKKINILYLKFKKKRLDKKDTEKSRARLEKCNIKLTKIEEKVSRIRIKRKENLEKPYKIQMKKNPNIKWLIIIMLVCALMGLITPLGDTPYTYLYKTMQGETTKNINEHLPLTIAENVPMLCTIIIILSVMIFTKTKIQLSDLLMIGGLAYLMFYTRRQASIFVLIGSIAFNRMAIQLIELYGSYKIKDSIKMVDFVTIIVMCATVLGLSKHFYKGKDKRPYVNTSTYPVKAAEWIKENLEVNNIRLFNEYNYGSYLLFKDIPVFIDSRADLYSPEFNEGCNVFMDFINTSGIGKYYGETFEKYGITHVILYKNAKINLLINKADSEKYELLYSDEDFVIYKILEY